MTDYNDFLNHLDARLSTNGLSVQRAINFDGYLAELVATEVRLSRLRGNRVRVIIATTMDAPTTDAIMLFSESAYKYCLANSLSLMQLQKPPKGMIYLYVIPITISQDFQEDVKEWMSTRAPPKHDSGLNYPILMASSNGLVYRCKKLPFIGGPPWKRTMNFVQQHLG